MKRKLKEEVKKVKRGKEWNACTEEAKVCVKIYRFFSERLTVWIRAEIKTDSRDINLVSIQ